MPLFEQFRTAITESGQARHLLASASLQDVFTHLDQCAAALQSLKGTQKAPTDGSAFEQWGSALCDLEQRSKNEDHKPWRFVFDAPILNHIYIEDPVVQICTGEPEYHRFIMTFAADGIKIKFDTDCVSASPDLSTIRAKYKNITLDKRKQQDEQLGVQRVAILGPARVFIHGNDAKPEHQALVSNAEIQLNRFLDVYEHAQPRHGQGEPLCRFRTTNGGWGGKAEGSTGMPLVSGLVGVILEKKTGKLPVTVMPSGGAYDRLEGIPRDNYFEVPGTWGDDSKYLVGYSSSALVFEPYGFWTEIEIRNAVAQGKPVAVITAPGKLQMNEYEEINVNLPNGKMGSYRKYCDGAKAAIWMARCWNITFLERFQESHSLTPEVNQKLNQLKKQYLTYQSHGSFKYEIKFIPLVQSAIAAVSNEHKRDLKLELVKLHGMALELLSSHDKKDPEMVALAIQQNPEAIKFASSTLQKNPLMIQLANSTVDSERVGLCKQLLTTAPTSRLVELLIKYKLKRDQNPNQFYYHGLFSCFSNSYSKDKKFEAVDHLIACATKHTSVSKDHLGALRQGELGKIIKQWEKRYGENITAFAEPETPQPGNPNHL